MKRFILHKNSDMRGDVLEKLVAFLHKLGRERSWAIEIKEYRRNRSQQQNRYLWGVCYATILIEGGEHLAGWTNEDLHEYFLGEHFGWETLEGFGRKRMKPIRRSSGLTVTEFADYVDFIHRKAAELGIYIPSPDEEFEGGSRMKDVLHTVWAAAVIANLALSVGSRDWSTAIAWFACLCALAALYCERQENAT